MRKRSIFLSFILIALIITAFAGIAAAVDDAYVYLTHRTKAVLVDGKSNYTTSIPTFDRIYIQPMGITWTTEVNDAPLVFTIKNATFAWRCDYTDGKPSSTLSSSGSNQTFSAGCYSTILSNMSESSLYDYYWSYYSLYPHGYTGTPDSNDDSYFYGDASETGLRLKAVEMTFPDGYIGTDTTADYFSTNQQMATGVPYVELITNENGAITGAKWRYVLPTDTDNALVFEKNTEFNVLYYITVRTSDKKTYFLTQDPENPAKVSKDNLDPGSPLQGTMYVANVDGPIPLSNVEYVELSYIGAKGTLSLSEEVCFYTWRFYNNGGSSGGDPDPTPTPDPDPDGGKTLTLDTTLSGNSIVATATLPVGAPTPVTFDLYDAITGRLIETKTALTKMSTGIASVTFSRPGSGSYIVKASAEGYTTEASQPISPGGGDSSGGSGGSSGGCNTAGLAPLAALAFGLGTLRRRG